VLARRQFQPFLGHHGIEAGQRLDALEVFAEGPVEAVVEGFVLDQQGARQQIEIVQAAADQPRLQRFEQGQQFRWTPATGATSGAGRNRRALILSLNRRQGDCQTRWQQWRKR
jgi:hypothetical protein